MTVVERKEHGFYKSIYQFLADEDMKEEFAEFFDIDDPAESLSCGGKNDPIEVDGFHSDTDAITKLIDQYWDGLYTVGYDNKHEGIFVDKVGIPKKYLEEHTTNTQDVENILQTVISEFKKRKLLNERTFENEFGCKSFDEIVEKITGVNCKTVNEHQHGICLECDKPIKVETDIQLCQECMEKFDVEQLWNLHDKNKLDALDFNENESMRERFRKGK